MAKPQRKAIIERTPCISATTATLRKTLSATPANSLDITKNRKDKLLSILDKTSDKFLDSLNNGQIQLNNVKDIDTVARLVLVLSGEADKIKGKVGTEETETKTLTGNSKVEEILSRDDPAVQDVFKKLFDGYSQINDVV